jgi:hypothetical protein
MRESKQGERGGRAGRDLAQITMHINIAGIEHFLHGLGGFARAPHGRCHEFVPGLVEFGLVIFSSSLAGSLVV